MRGSIAGLLLLGCVPGGGDPVTGLFALEGEFPAVQRFETENELLYAGAFDARGPVRERTRAVGFLARWPDGTWCTAALVGTDLALTAEACAAEPLSGTELFLRRERGVPRAEWARYPCDRAVFRGDGLALLSCEGEPGARFGSAPIRAGHVAPGLGLYLVQQGGDPLPDKSVSQGVVLSPASTFEHAAPGFPGGIGAPLFSVETDELIAVHLGGTGDGLANRAIRVAAALPERAGLGLRASAFGAPPRPPDPFEPNDEEPDATAARLGFETSAPWIGHDDRDVFRVELGKGGIASVHVQFEHNHGDLDVTVHDGAVDGPRVAWGGSTDDDEKVRFRAPRDGPYFVVVYGFRGAINDYSISLR